MSETITRPQLSDPFSGGMQLEDERAHSSFTAPNSMVPVEHSAVDEAQASIVLAQRVPIKRNQAAVLQEVRKLATAAGNEFYYSIPFKDGERTTRVEGLTIQGAMAVMMAYGNCRVRCLPVRETATHWTFLAQFDDYEKGTSVLRSFNQRKAQNTGMRDRGRQEDILFQIGQSKGIRNVIIAALGWLCEQAFEAAKSGVLDKFASNPEAARNYLIQRLNAMEISVSRVERAYGRLADKWLARDMAQIYAEIGSVKDFSADVDQLWPLPEPSGGQVTQINAAAAAQQHQRPAQAAAEPKPRQARKPAEDKPKPAFLGGQDARTETPREDTLDADAAFLGGPDVQTHGSHELDADAAKLEGLGQDPGPTMGTDLPSEADELRFE